MMNATSFPEILDIQKTDKTATLPSSVAIDLTSKSEPEEDENQYKTATLWNIEYYQQFFDVDTDEVLEKIKWSFIPHGNFLQNFITGNPDLYGPFWICITVIFALGIFGNLSDYFLSRQTNVQWKYEFHTITAAATVIFSYGCIFPCLLWATIRWYGSEHGNLKLIEIISLYGYCFTVFLPLSFLWLIPFRWFQWTITIVGASISGLVITKSIYPVFTKQIYPVLFLLLILHVFVASVFMIHFFPTSGFSNTNKTVINNNT